MRIAGIVLVAVASLGIVACNSGAAQKQPFTEAEFEQAALWAAASANLNLNDFPVGWTAEPADPEDESSDGVDGPAPEGSAPECGELFAAFNEDDESDEAKAAAKATSDDFETEDGQGISTEVEVYRTVGEARADEIAFDGLFETCGEDLERYIETGINEDAAASGEEYRVSGLNFHPMQELDLGDWARQWGFDVTYEFGAVRVNATIMLSFIRVGRVSGTFEQFAIDAADERLAGLLRALFAGRLAQADGTLGDER